MAPYTNNDADGSGKVSRPLLPQGASHFATPLIARLYGAYGGS
jgi:hypothetical protein